MGLGFGAGDQAVTGLGAVCRGQLVCIAVSTLQQPQVLASSILSLTGL